MANTNNLILFNRNGDKSIPVTMWDKANCLRMLCNALDNIDSGGLYYYFDKLPFPEVKIVVPDDFTSEFIVCFDSINGPVAYDVHVNPITKEDLDMSLEVYYIPRYKKDGKDILRFDKREFLLANKKDVTHPVYRTWKINYKNFMNPLELDFVIRLVANYLAICIQYDDCYIQRNNLPLALTTIISSFNAASNSVDRMEGNNDYLNTTWEDVIVK